MKLVFLLAAIVSAVFSLHIANGPAQGTFYLTPAWDDWGPKEFNVTLPIIDWLSHSGPNDFAFRQGKIWLVRTNGSRGDEDFLKKTWHSGERPFAMVLSAGWKTPPGAGNYVRYIQGPHNDINIAALQIDFIQWYYLQATIAQYDEWAASDPAAFQPMQVRITSDETSEWDRMYRHWINWVFWLGIMGTIFAALIAYGIYKGYHLIKHRGFQYSIPHVIIAFETIANLLRFVMVVIDPIYARRIFPPTFESIMITISFPFCVFSTLLVTLYWYELMRKSKMSSMRTANFLSKLHIPFWIFFIALLAFELASSITRGTGVSKDFYKIVRGVSGVYAIVVLSVSIFFMYTGLSLINTLQTSYQQYDNPAFKKLMKTTWLLLSSIIGQACFAITVILMATTWLLYQPWLSWILWVLAYVSMAFISAMFLFAVHTPHASGSTESEVDGNTIPTSAVYNTTS